MRKSAPSKVVIVIATAIFFYVFDEQVVFPAIHNYPSPFDGVFRIIAVGLELAGLWVEWSKL
jgi:hypothetical protein